MVTVLGAILLGGTGWLLRYAHGLAKAPEADKTRVHRLVASESAALLFVVALVAGLSMVIWGLTA